MDFAYPKSYFAQKIGFTELLRKFFDSIAKHCSRHRLISRQKILLQKIFITLSHFAEQPAHSFVDKIVLMVEQNVRNGQAVIKLIMADKLRT